MYSNTNSDSNVSSMLNSIKQCANGLSERHLNQQYNNTDYGPALRSLIASALRDLSQCIDIINTRAPVFNLTQDVLSVIFHQAHQDDLAAPDPQGTWFPPSIPVPLCLSQVSKSWKSVATNLPTLWTAVKVTTPWSLASIETCLSMSKSLPIDLYIKGLKWKHRTFFLDPTLYHHKDDIEGLCHILLRHIRRCRSIFITTDRTFWPLLLEVEKQFSSQIAPVLETLSIIGTSPYDEGFTASGYLFGHDTPRLSDVRLDVNALVSCRPPFESVTSLSLTGADGFDFGGFVDILSECTILETLIIYGDLVPIWLPSPTGLSLPKLRSIQLHGRTSLTIRFLLDLSTPSLVDLFVDPYFPHDWTSFNTNMGPLPFPTLKMLTISPHIDINTTSEAIRSAFNDASSYFPHIESLTLVGKESRRMLQGLAETKDSEAWPSLQNLTLPAIPDESSEGALCEFVTLRKAAHAALPRILLDRGSLLRMARLNWLRTHVDVVEHNVVPVHVGDPTFPEIEDGGLEEDW